MTTTVGNAARDGTRVRVILVYGFSSVVIVLRYGVHKISIPSFIFEYIIYHVTCTVSDVNIGSVP